MTSTTASSELSPTRIQRHSVLLPRLSNGATCEVSPESAIPTTFFGTGSDQETVDTSRRGSRVSSIFGKVSEIIHSTLSGRSRTASISTTATDDQPPVLEEPTSTPMHHPEESPLNVRPPLSTIHSVKETRKVFLEYDPASKRKVLNTYEILREIGRGEHGKVKLARDLESQQLVAIKIVNRRSKRERPTLRQRRDSKAAQDVPNEYEQKIKREIAIMKKCNHRHIVKLKEVLDDLNSYKIYLVLEYLEKGEIKWKRKASDGVMPKHPINDDIPCCGETKRKTSLSFNDTEEADNLLSDEYTPNLTFKQSRKILRDVILGLEYLHLQGIVHRDIKPANLLVSSDNVVKISDFGVSFASSLNRNDEGFLVNEVELAKTAGTPAFFAPELCQTNFYSPSSSSTSVSNALEMTKRDDSQNSTNSDKLPKVDHKIDIWALGITLYCLLFGKVPFNADSEFKLFQVIVNDTMKFPESCDSFNSPARVSQEEFELAMDLLKKMLDKNRKTRIDIPEIKKHPFVLMDLENDVESLEEFIYSNQATQDHLEQYLFCNEVSAEEMDNAVVGVGSRIRKSLAQAIRSGKRDSTEIKRRFFQNMEPSSSTSSEESSIETGNSNGFMKLNSNDARSVILSEALQVTTPPLSGSGFHLSSPSGDNVGSFLKSAPHVASNLSVQKGIPSRSPSYSAGGGSGSREMRAPNLLLQEVMDSQSPIISRRGSSAGTTEAAQIETKRNVGGDLYLKNQSAIDTFKDIQQQDDKRRRSSAFASPTSSNYNTAENSMVLPESSKLAPSYKPQHLKVSSIQIEDKRRSSVISLPLSESFASLDSFSDDYLTQRYVPENPKKNHSSNQRRRSSSASQINEVYFKDEGHESPMVNINERMKNFDLGSSMKPRGITFDLKGKDEDVEPTEKPLCNKPGFGRRIEIPQRKDSYSSYSSSCSSSQSDGESSEEEGNLTLAFASKVAPTSRPHFLSQSNRAKSHDSHLPRLAHQNVYDVPIIFHEQNAEFEDVPAGLMANVPRPSISMVPSNMTPSISILSSNTSSATITPHLQSPVGPPMAADRNYEKKTKPQIFSNFEVAAEEALVQPLTPNSKFDKMQKEFYTSDRISSPLANNAPSADNATINSHMVAAFVHGDNKNHTFLNSQFNNHYKKDPIQYPFPNALHYENDKESASKSTTKVEVRPPHYRSSSVTVGLLQLHKPKEDRH
ncbi:SNF1-activating kinase 1 [[Candida] anglica]|uniref:SNF1-activating kinase 1 n=1 Tax=[Candida] anglica TaxID=148631 RepID=A0ABP0EEZ0_9ASCO